MNFLPQNVHEKQFWRWPAAVAATVATAVTAAVAAAVVAVVAVVGRGEDDKDWSKSWPGAFIFTE